MTTSAGKARWSWRCPLCNKRIGGGTFGGFAWNLANHAAKGHGRTEVPKRRHERTRV